MCYGLCLLRYRTRWVSAPPDQWGYRRPGFSIMHASSNTAVNEVTNVALMGTGEPFHNYTEYNGRHRTARQCTATGWLNLGCAAFHHLNRRPRSDDPQVCRKSVRSPWPFAACLRRRAPWGFDAVNKRYPIEVRCWPACREYVEKTGRRITFELGSDPRCKPFLQSRPPPGPTPARFALPCQCHPAQPDHPLWRAERPPRAGRGLQSRFSK